MSEPEHRPEVAIAIALPLWIEAKRASEGDAVNGYAIAIGWDRPQSTTFYLVSDSNSPRPLWISEDDVTSNSVREPD